MIGATPVDPGATPVRPQPFPQVVPLATPLTPISRDRYARISHSRTKSLGGYLFPGTGVGGVAGLYLKQCKGFYRGRGGVADPGAPYISSSARDRGGVAPDVCGCQRVVLLSRRLPFRGRNRMRPELSCCRPRRVPMPSGWRWVHSRSCPVDPNQTVRSAAEQRARFDHPAGKGTGDSGGSAPVPSTWGA